MFVRGRSNAKNACNSQLNAKLICMPHPGFYNGTSSLRRNILYRQMPLPSNRAFEPDGSPPRTSSVQKDQTDAGSHTVVMADRTRQDWDHHTRMLAWQCCSCREDRLGRGRDSRMHSKVLRMVQHLALQAALHFCVVVDDFWKRSCFVCRLPRAATPRSSFVAAYSV